MSTTTIAKKRKSADGNASVSKKVKIAKSADKPGPVKSALKKSKSSIITQQPIQNGSTRKTTTKKAVEEATDDIDDTPDLTADQTAALLAGFSSDSSDNDASDAEETGLALSTLPKAPTTKALQQQLALATTTSDPEHTPAVLYIGRIPHGFHEPQMRSYFSQFGSITNLRLARNKKTGRSQHYGFIEFASSAVAEIVRKTMDKYLLFGHLLQVRGVARENVGENMFGGSGRKARRRAPRNRMEGRRLERGAGREEWERRVEREVRRRSEKGEKLKELGYEFDMPAVKGVEDVPVKGKEVEREVSSGEKESEGEVKLLTDGDNVKEGEEMNAVVVEEKVTKKRAASGKTETKKKVKKTKT